MKSAEIKLKISVFVAESIFNYFPHFCVSGVDGLWESGVKYSPSYVCALKGSTVKISCTLTYTSYKLIKGFWTKPVGESADLCSDPEKRRGIQCLSENINTYSLTLMNVTEADKLVYYCRFIYGQNRWTGIPGSWLDVTGTTNKLSEIKHRNILLAFE